MRNFCLSGTLLFMLLAGNRSFAQDFSNKGKEFWLCFPSHVPSSGLANMVLFITSDKNSKGTITANGFSSTFIVTANQIAGPYSIPYGNAYITDAESGSVVNKGIHVKVDDGQAPVVVFTHIYAGFRSEASLILPVSTLGKKYYSTNYWQASTNNSKSQFEIIATESNTVVQYQLRRNGILDPTVNNRTLNNPGDVLQIQDPADLTGSVIESVASGTGSCKRIAVFSGSSCLAIGRAGCTPSSYDPLYQQCYPVNTWGKNFGIVPLANNFNGCHVRVTASENNTIVNFNGTNITLNAGEYYPASSPSAIPYVGPMTISADKPISVAQYLMSANCAGSTPIAGQAQGDPEMILLNPVEQSINDINIFSSNLQTIRTKYLCVYIKSTYIPSFKINGVAPFGTFVPMPSGNGYSYLVEDLTSYSTQSFRLTADSSGFNAMTYGMGDAESYGYSAGTNVKDLYQFVSINNEYATSDFPVACKGAPFSFSMTFPYEPTQIVWQFNGLFPDVTINSPVYDATSVVNGKTLYRYDLPGTYNATTPGTFPIKVVAQNPTPDGCSGVQEIEYDLEIYDLPAADFNFNTSGCVSNPVSFTGSATGTNGRPIIHWHWNFGDNNIANDVSTTSHTYATAGTYNVKYTVITDVGCKADTVIHAVVLNDPPVAGFTPSSPYCAGRTVAFTDNSVGSSGSIIKWHWNFGDGPTTVFTSGDQTHTYAATGPYTVTLQVETASGCLSTIYSNTITVSPNPVVNFSLPNVCLPSGSGQFNSTSSISDGTESQFIYLWNFGDATPTAGGQNPVHIFTGTGPYNVKLLITSNNGCADSLTQSINTIYAEPQAGFNAPTEVCFGTAVNFTDQSNAPGSSVTQWQWDFGDLTTSTLQNPTKTYAVPGTYTVTLSATSAIGCQTVSNTHIATRTVIVNALPTVNFNTSLPGCAGKGVTFTDASAPNSGSIIKWTWDYGDATNAVLTTGAPFIHTYSAVNTYNATLQVETDKGCISSVLPKSVVINAIPVAQFTPPIICVNDINVPFADASTGSVTAWDWNFGDPNANAGNPNTSILQNPTHHYTLPGTYTAQLIATNSAGCKDTIPHTVTVNGGLLTPNFAIQNTTALCSNKSITLKDASTIDAGKILKVEIFWDPADATIKTTDNNPVPGATYTHTYPEFGTPAFKTYTVTYIVYSGITCSNTFTKNIDILATPQLAFSSVIPVCSNVPAFQLTQTQLINALPGAGTFTGSGVSASGLFDPQSAGAGTHNITYTYTGTNGCSNSVDQTVIVDPTPIADAGPDRVVLEGGYVVLSPTLVTNIPVTYSWTPSLYLNDPSVAKPQASPLTDFTYTLQVTSDKGCTTSDDVFVKLLKKLVVPEYF